jgi:nucleotide-binding universal stress UspA family protein
LGHSCGTCLEFDGGSAGQLLKEAGVTSDGEARPYVVVGVDGSRESAAALRWAGRYAAVAGASVRAVLAWHYPTVVSGPPVGLTPTAVSDEVKERLTATLAEAIAEAAPPPGVHIDAEIHYGHPVAVLVEQSSRADLLVVGRNGHGAFVGMLFGSVTQHCVAAAECPVVVVHDPPVG